MPMLCVAGLLEHPCAHDSGHSDHAEHSHSESGCLPESDGGHDSDCNSDPCVQDLIRPARMADDCPALVLAHATLLLVADTESARTRDTVLIARGASHPGACLPVYRSDLPLQI
ncbi:MAG: hypothetical protein GY842_10095 [bacterium]|nr:hypothetical protein [bacterium]